MGELVNYAVLKPCPFCGEPQIGASVNRFMKKKIYGDTWLIILCSGCGANIKGHPELGDTRESTIAAWNRREGA